MSSFVAEYCMSDNQLESGGERVYEKAFPTKAEALAFLEGIRAADHYYCQHILWRLGVKQFPISRTLYDVYRNVGLLQGGLHGSVAEDFDGGILFRRYPTRAFQDLVEREYAGLITRWGM